MTANPLGEFLRTRRERIRVDAVGGQADRRRAPGLRREEVAILAGVSAEYYKRLEQGRDRHPSPGVITAIGRALNLNQDEVDYLRLLTYVGPGMNAQKVAEAVSPSLIRLLDSWSDTAAFVVNSACDVLACTPLASAVHPGLARDSNMVRLMFLDPEERALYVDWPQAAADCVSWLRSMTGSDLGHSGLPRLIHEMMSRSGEFSELWQRHEVSIKSAGSKRLVHPTLGELNIEFDTFTVNGSAGQSLIIYHVEPGTADAAVLAALARTATLDHVRTGC